MDKRRIAQFPTQQHTGTRCLRIDGELVFVPADQLKQARQQLGLRSDAYLLGATRLLEFDSGYGVVRIPLPGKQVVVAFEGPDGQRVYGVVTLDALSFHLSAP
ncbi:MULTISPECIES: hypothetical protein [unclassified Pseudomonas]|uniref:hypothetical protein n=1 Tax=unclassified Pseudomonas TaxID=196821 RepID=UPI000C868C41|nr:MULTISPECIES: hypothetical protein [unclassified Pseudomonas]PMV27286.1 hypothetical protein C1X17_00425 [Pseudomonas sp. FW305-3-2-15-C-TSA2]PMV32541.1 hypothetical protein C1X22_00425 [Pseudomonas sp. DP16D-L5]PMV42255.1 hypothetical protein C1X21_00425 [Pseudomonas sp. FW305-3-2-15-A-LB2]PMV49705.1 hypothetical protein C1X16_01975 [Pseudomonas sp. FW305-3-2-15-C-R2A1]PMV55179.1 hypothetical protein C1X18_00425 [Pseudomonas sp. FW305-3-2-15-C-LB1]